LIPVLEHDPLLRYSKLIGGDDHWSDDEVRIVFFFFDSYQIDVFFLKKKNAQFSLRAILQDELAIAKEEAIKKQINLFEHLEKNGIDADTP
jgi:hypothetical protein